MIDVIDYKTPQFYNCYSLMFHFNKTSIFPYGKYTGRFEPDHQ